MMRNLCLVALGGALGAVARYLIGLALQQRLFPLGTFVANIVGCLLIGLLAQAHLASYLTPAARLLWVTGALGALTTFSTFAYETIRSYQDESWRWAAFNVAMNVVVGLIAVVVGLQLGRYLWPIRSS